jgi:hypothetical protein
LSYTVDSDGICPNINTTERRKRLRMGVVTFVVGLAVLAVLVYSGVNRFWRLPLVLFFWAAASGYSQWRDKTCVGLARLNSRKIGEERKKIEGPAELAQVKQQARRVQLKSLVAGIVMALIALLLPVGF